MTTLYHQTMKALEDSLQCSLIASDLDFQRGVKQTDADDDEILEYALSKRFTRIPLFSRQEGQEKVITHVAIVDLGQKRVESRPNLTTEDVVAGCTPISRAIDLLSRRPFYFVLDPDQIRKILTKSDLNRLPVRTYLHTVLDHLEWLLAESIEGAFRDDEWIQLLSDSARDRISGLHETKRREDFDTRLIDCSLLTEKATVVAKSEGLLSKLGEDRRKEFEDKFGQVNRLRNRLGHGLPPLNKEADTLRDQLRHGGQLTKQADLAWLNDVVGHLQAWIDALSEGADD